MSTLEANNIKKGSKTVDTDYILNGSAKAWISFNGTGTVSIQDSMNVSSIVDNGTADYTTNFTNDLINNDFTSGGIACDNNGGTTPCLVWVKTKNVGSSNIALRGTNNVSYDSAIVDFIVHGDLA